MAVGAVVVVVVAALVAAAFLARSGDGDGDATAAAGSVTVSDAWVSVSLDVGAAYLTIDNTGEVDTLIEASSPAGATVSLMDEDHGPGAHDGHDHVHFDVPPGTTRLEPGVGHVMLQDLTGPLEPGDVVDLELGFEQAGTVSVSAPVLDWEEVADRLDR